METRILILILSYLATSEGAKILGVFPIGGMSHYAPAEAIMKALAANGHQVTSISSYPQKKPLLNFRDIDVSEKVEIVRNYWSIDWMLKQLQDPYPNFLLIETSTRFQCENIYSIREVCDLLNEKFDLVLTEIFGADCTVGFAWKFKAPLISVTSTKPLPWVYSRIGNPSNPAVRHQIYVDYSPKMSFFERLVNTYYHLLYSYLHHTSHNGPKSDEISRKFFGPDVPLVNDIIMNTSLVFVNSHHSMDVPYPMVPNLIEIGGIHLKEPKLLPANIQKFMDEAENGVIYFTLGSLILTSSLPNETIEAFKQAFAKLPAVKVLWKFESEVEDMPANVLVRNWFPQSDILAHPNLKVYITHGGQSGTIEAVHYGVPLVGIPLFHDQRRNIRTLVDKGAAIKIGLNELTQNKIYTALTTVLFDKRYTENMRAVSQRFRDRPMTPAQTAVYWTEYVLRYKGAHHLQTPAVRMPWYQYLLLDVIFFIVCVLCLVVFIIYYFYKIEFNIVRTLCDVMKV